VTFQVGTDTTTTSWVAKAKAGSATASATSTITRKVARLSLSPVTLTAGESVTATIYTADGAGKALGSKTVALVAPSGVTVTPATGTTDSTGALAVTLTATNSVVIGEKTLQATSGTTVAALEFSVTPAPSSVTLERPQVTLARGANGTLNVTVNGARGDAVSGVLVTVTGGDAGVNVSSKLTTNVLGVAQLKLHARSTAASGARTLTVAVAGVASRTFSVVVP
jgi:adhesin/invasin